MAGLDPAVRERTDALDSLGNTTAATGKGFAIGSAALTALAFIAAYKDSIEQIVEKNSDLTFKFDLSILNPNVLIGLLIGTMVTFAFSSFTMSAVGRAASKIVIEVRRQFKEIKGLMEGKSDPDYASCVDICTKSALRELIIIAAIALITPIAVGLILGPNGVAGLLGGSTTSGFVLAVMMSNSGGAWDNAKKYIEAGNCGGKGSENHKATVVGDTVGDPFKDTSGPALNILIKLMSVIAIVFGMIILKFSPGHLEDVQAAVATELEADDRAEAVGEEGARSARRGRVADHVPGRRRGPRQIRDAPGLKGKPLSSPTYHQPSGPTATDVGTASAGSEMSVGMPRKGGRCEVETSAFGNLATVVTRPRADTAGGRPAGVRDERPRAAEDRHAVRVRVGPLRRAGRCRSRPDANRGRPGCRR